MVVVVPTHLSDDQKEVFKHIIEEPLTMLPGEPGTGKTHLIGEVVNHLHIVKRWGSENILVVTRDGKAKTVVQKEINDIVFRRYANFYHNESYNIPCMFYTIDMCIQMLSTNTKTDPYMFKKVKALIVDECSNVSVEQIHGLLSHLGDRLLKLIYVGDLCQLPPVVTETHYIKDSRDDTLIEDKESFFSRMLKKAENYDNNTKFVYRLTTNHRCASKDSLIIKNKDILLEKGIKTRSEKYKTPLQYSHKYRTFEQGRQSICKDILNDGNNSFIKWNIENISNLDAAIQALYTIDIVIGKAPLDVNKTMTLAYFNSIVTSMNKYCKKHTSAYEDVGNLAINDRIVFNRNLPGTSTCSAIYTGEILVITSIIKDGNKNLKYINRGKCQDNGKNIPNIIIKALPFHNISSGGGASGDFVKTIQLSRVMEMGMFPQYAAATTITKSQGSEADNVVLLYDIPQHNEKLKKSLQVKNTWYTAITRGKKRVVILHIGYNTKPIHYLDFLY